MAHVGQSLPAATAVQGLSVQRSDACKMPYTRGWLSLPSAHAWLVRGARLWSSLAAIQGFRKRLALNTSQWLSGVRKWMHGPRRALVSVGMQLAFSALASAQKAA